MTESRTNSASPPVVSEWRIVRPVISRASKLRIRPPTPG
jgi:hypothetical protein